jgi:hypothetical protein
MSDLDIRTVVQAELNNIAPEVDMAMVDPVADAPPATIHCRIHKRGRTAPRAESAPASSMCLGRSRVRQAAGWCARSASCGRAKIGLQNLAYNIRRFLTLHRIAVA